MVVKIGDSLKFVDMADRDANNKAKKFTSSDWKVVKKTNKKTGKDVYFAVAKTPSGKGKGEAWRIIGPNKPAAKTA